MEQSPQHGRIIAGRSAVPSGGHQDHALRTVVAAALLLAAALQAGGAQWAIAGGMALFVAGLPHGVYDERGRPLLIGWQYVFRYVALGLVAGFLFLLQPVAMLSVFLLLSAWHFIREAEAGGLARRIAIGALAIGGSALVRPDDTRAVFALLCGTAVPPGMMMVLGVTGAAGYGIAATALFRQPRDPALWLILASPLLFHPVLATGLIFWLGHAGLLTRRLARQRRWSAANWTVLGGSAVAAASVTCMALPVTSALLPFYAAGAVALIMPHLVPLRWLSPATAKQAALPHRSQAATSPAT